MNIHKTSWNAVVGRVAAAGMLLLAARPGWAAVAEENSPAWGAAQAALREERWPEAFRAFEVVRAEARRARDRARLADAEFYLGLVRQQQAEHSTDAAARERWLAEAARHYEAAMRGRTNTGGIRNNLAQVLARQGRLEEALRTLEEALALPDERQGFYAENYAALLLEAGRWRDACRFYALAAWAQPDYTAPAEKLVALCLEHELPLLITYLWEMVNHGQVLQAERQVPALLDDPRWEPAQRRELLTVLAAALTRHAYAPREFLGRDSARELRRHFADATVGEGARELLRLHAGEDLEPRSFRWWGQLPAGGPEPASGRGAAETFQALARSLGERCQAAGDLGLAERYYRVAAELDPRLPDPEAFTALANLYAGDERLDRLAELMREHEGELFEGKGEAYRQADPGQIYRFHSALGVIYSHLGRWGDSGRVNSAIFQFERALAVAEEASRSGTTAKPIQVPPQLVMRLADGYERTAQATKSARLQLEQAERYLGVEDRQSADQLLRRLEQSGLAPRPGAPEKLQFDRCVEAVRNPPTTRVTPDLGAGIRGRPGIATGPEAAAPEVRLAPDVRAVGVGSGQVPIGMDERRRWEAAVGDLLREAAADAMGPRQFELLRGDRLPAEVKAVEVDGRRGRLILQKDGAAYETEFTLPSQPASSTLHRRFIRAGEVKGVGTKTVRPSRDGR
ncbi:MAG: tetratricopeptide repeat protein [Verrucomicrobiales bacterium]|nr:tetratricopeptide repeat protein [Verrucomicrobiales bacterium]